MACTRTLAIWLPIWLGPVLLIWVLNGWESVWTQLGGFFSVMAVVTFGGAYAVLAYVAKAAVSFDVGRSARELVPRLKASLSGTSPTN